MNRSLEDNRFNIRIVRESSSLLAGGIRSELLESGTLAAVTQIELEEQLHIGQNGKPWLTRDNPYLSDAQREQIDANGLIRVGAIVNDYSVLASILSPSGAPQEGRCAVVDTSWRCPAARDGAEVVAVERESSAGRRRDFPRGVLERMRVRLRQVIPFHLTDSFAIGETILPTRYVVEDAQAPTDRDGRPLDLVISHAAADTLQLAPGELRSVSVRRVEPASVDVLRARSIGPYSLISLTPLGSGRCAGATVTNAHIQWLAERKLFGLVSEFASLKSDDLQNRPSLQRLTKIDFDDGLRITGAAPESLFEIIHKLWALGLNVSASTSKGGVAVTLKPASDDDIVHRSSGVIGKPETINYRTNLPVPGGLFCETVFGSEDSSIERRRRAGHIELTEPIIPMIWRLGSSPVLAKILDCPPKHIEALLSQNSIVYDKDGVRQFRSAEDAAGDQRLDDGWTNLRTGVGAIQALLASVDPARVPPAFGPRGERFFLRTIPVIPPDLRPIVLLDSGNFATSDLNDFYRRVINRNNRLRKLKDLNAPGVIITGEIQELQLEVDRFHANTFLPNRSKTLRDEGRALRCLLSLVTERVTDGSKNVDFSGRAKAIADSEIEASQVGIPEKIFDELRLRAEQPVLLTKRGPFVARLPRRVGYPLLRLHARDANDFGLDRVFSVHRPLTQVGLDDARRMLMNERLEVSSRTDSDDWSRHASPTAMLDDLIDAAVSNRTATMTSGRGLSLFGVGPTTSNVPDRKSRPTTYWVDSPPEQPPKPLPALEELASNVEAHRRICCFWTAEKSLGDIDVAEGRIGGVPRMPPGAKWPCDPDGEAYEFVGQFPLEPARRAGLIPFSIPPRALLTVFWTGQWENAASTHDGTLLIHESENLVELPPPKRRLVSEPYAIRCEITDVYPHAKEALEILLWEVEDSTPAEWAKFEKDYSNRFFNPEDVSRIGGYPHWIQNPVDIPFVAQIASDGVSDINFYDSGSMYIYGRSADNLTALVQCY